MVDTVVMCDGVQGGADGVLGGNIMGTSCHVEANLPDLGESGWVRLMMTVWGSTQGRDPRAEGVRG